MLTITVAILMSASLTVLFLFFLIYSWDFFTTLKAPFIPIPKKIIPRIVKALDVKDNSLVYDLGCGDARVLIECYKDNSRARYVGIEKARIPRFLSWLKLKKLNNPQNIKILYCDFFKSDLSQATHIFVYLLPQMMNDLLPKFIEVLKRGTILVSYNFAFSQKSPAVEILIEKDKKNKIGKLYIYEF